MVVCQHVKYSQFRTLEQGNLHWCLIPQSSTSVDWFMQVIYCTFSDFEFDFPKKKLYEKTKIENDELVSRETQNEIFCSWRGSNFLRFDIMSFQPNGRKTVSFRKEKHFKLFLFAFGEMQINGVIFFCFKNIWEKKYISLHQKSLSAVEKKNPGKISICGECFDENRNDFSCEGKFWHHLVTQITIPLIVFLICLLQCWNPPPISFPTELTTIKGKHKKLCNLKTDADDAWHFLNISDP